MLKKHEHVSAVELTQSSSRVFQRDGLRLSVRLENIYWDQLQELADTDAISLNSLIFQVTSNLAPSVNKTAALRVFVPISHDQIMRAAPSKFHGIADT